MVPADATERVGLSRTRPDFDASRCAREVAGSAARRLSICRLHPGRTAGGTGPCGTGAPPSAPAAAISAGHQPLRWDSPPGVLTASSSPAARGPPRATPAAPVRLAGPRAERAPGHDAPLIERVADAQPEPRARQHLSIRSCRPGATGIDHDSRLSQIPLLFASSGLDTGHTSQTSGTPSPSVSFWVPPKPKTKFAQFSATV